MGNKVNKGVKFNKKNRWKTKKNAEGRTIGQQRAKVRKDKEEALKEVSREREETAMAKLEDSFFVKTMFIRGIYFLYRDNQIVYIGMSKDNVMDRVVQHYKDPKKEFSRFRYLGNCPKCRTFETEKAAV